MMAKGSKVEIIKEDGSERTLMPGCSKEGYGWNGNEISASGNELGRIAVVGKFRGQYILDIYSPQDGKSSLALGSASANSNFPHCPTLFFAY